METLNNLIRYVASLSELSDTFVTELSARVRRYTLRKGSPLKSPGSGKSLWYVQRGILKASYFDDDGREHISRFWRENQIVLIKPNSYKDISSADYLIMLEDTVLFFLSGRDVLYLLANFAEASRIASILIRQDRDQAELLSYLLRLPLRQAYGKFGKIHPASRIPIQDIARYLGVSPKRISEIRAFK